jgi:hypothetical protein
MSGATSIRHCKENSLESARPDLEIFDDSIIRLTNVLRRESGRDVEPSESEGLSLREK